ASAIRFLIAAAMAVAQAPGSARGNRGLAQSAGAGTRSAGGRPRSGSRRSFETLAEGGLRRAGTAIDGRRAIYMGARRAARTAARTRDRVRRRGAGTRLDRQRPQTRAH